MDVHRWRWLLARCGPAAIAIRLTLAAALVRLGADQGIIHRDLPANIKVRHDGTVKVLDFGLASVAQEAGAGPIDATEGVSSGRLFHRHDCPAG